MRDKENFIVALMMVVIIVGIYIINMLFPNDYLIYTSEGITYEKAVVVDIISENLEESDDFEGYEIGTQYIIVEFTNGDYKGEQIEITNSLSSTHNINVEIGTKIIVKCDRPENVTPYYSVYSYDRNIGIIVVGIMFILFMAFVARMKGIKSIIGLAMSLYVIGCFLLPAIYRGWSPIYMTIITVLLVSSISLLLLNGFCEKTYTAIVSTMIGVTISAIFFLILQGILNVSGYNLDDAEVLIMISRSTGLQIKEVFFSAVLISSLGAVIDTTMSIAASIYEIREVNPSMKKKELFQSGISIGQDMIGTMCQTLILAFVGSSIATLLVMISYGTQTQQFISSDYIALEIVQAISGSMAIIFAVPITAFLSTITHKS